MCYLPHNRYGWLDCTYVYRSTDGGEKNDVTDEGKKNDVTDEGKKNDVTDEGFALILWMASYQSNQRNSYFFVFDYEKVKSFYLCTYKAMLN